MTFAEIVNWCLNNQKDANAHLEGIKCSSEIINLNKGIIVNAGKLNHERKRITSKRGMADSLILTTAQMYNLRILTKDRDFKDLPNVELL